MKKLGLFLVIITSSLTLYSQTEPLWEKIEQIEQRNLEGNNANLISENRLFRLNEVVLKKILATIFDKTSNKNGIEIQIPNENGFLETFMVWESSNFEPELQAKYPDIRAYTGIGITDSKASLNFSFSPNGIQTMILRADNGAEFIEQYSKDKSVYVLVGFKNRARTTLPFACKTKDIALSKDLANKLSGIRANNQIFKTLRLALSCTAEYTAFFGGTVAGALAGMNATMTRVNGVFNKDLALKLEIIANDNLIIYTDAATDPYSDTGASGAWKLELQNNLTTVIGNSGYDIGHLFGASGGAGDAGCIGCVCVDPTIGVPIGKGSAFTSPTTVPQGDTFDIDYVAHEMGHQLGGNHTFSYAIEGTGVSVEPGSGSTIMAYAGATGTYDIQLNSDDYFAFASIQQIQDNLASKTCPMDTPIINSPPVISAGIDWTIPNGTAFILTGSGSDSNGNSMTYCWEQNDSATTQSGINSIAFPTKAAGPLFRSKYPSNTPVRYMPNFNDVVSNRLSTTWESVSSIARTLNFTLTGRDNATQGTAQTNTDAMIVNVSGAVGPFAVTSQNTADIGWPQGSNQTITWSVNGSNALMGSTNVNIKLSTDGGLTFPITLASNTPNDGTEIIMAPNITAINCRLLIEPSANIYYAVNTKSFAIGYSVTSECNTYTFDAPFAIPDGVGSYTTKIITAPASRATISNVTLAVGFTHAYLSDVQIELKSPINTTVKLFERSCEGINSSLLLNYDDLGSKLNCGTTAFQTISPFEPLSAFKGQNPQGEWSFRIRDAYSTDVGTLNSASITICTQTYILSTPSLEIDDFVLYPNPNKGSFSIRFTSKFVSGVKVLVHDLLGKLIFENQFEYEGVFNENIQLKNVQEGIYILTVIDGDRREVQKIVVE